MKQLIIILAAALSFTTREGFAQDEIQNIETDTAANCLTMRNGKVVIMQHGKSLILHQDTTLENGTRITPDGHIIRKDGSKMLMKTGQCFNLEGIRMSREPGDERKVPARGRCFSD